MEVRQSCINMSLRNTSRSLMRLYDEEMKESGITAAQMSLLGYIEVYENSSISSLAHLTTLDRTTVSRNLKSLVSGGLLEYASGSNKRERSVRLTPGGRAALDRAIPLWNRAQQKVLTEIGKETWEEVNRVLQRIRILAGDTE